MCRQRVPHSAYPTPTQQTRQDSAGPRLGWQFRKYALLDLEILRVHVEVKRTQINRLARAHLYDNVTELGLLCKRSLRLISHQNPFQS